jgi:hypothetical protein
MDKVTDMDKDTDMDKETGMVTYTDLELEYFCKRSICHTVPITPLGLPMTHHNANPNGAINLQHHFLIKIMTCKFS